MGKIRFKKFFTTTRDGGHPVNDSQSLISFAAKHASFYYSYESRGNEFEVALKTPFVFLYYLMFGPILYLYNGIPVKTVDVYVGNGRCEQHYIISPKSDRLMAFDEIETIDPKKSLDENIRDFKNS